MARIFLPRLAGVLCALSSCLIALTTVAAFAQEPAPTPPAPQPDQSPTQPAQTPATPPLGGLNATISGERGGGGNACSASKRTSLGTDSTAAADQLGLSSGWIRWWATAIPISVPMPSAEIAPTFDEKPRRRQRSSRGRAARLLALRTRLPLRASPRNAMVTPKAPIFGAGDYHGRRLAKRLMRAVSGVGNDCREWLVRPLKRKSCVMARRACRRYQGSHGCLGPTSSGLL